MKELKILFIGDIVGSLGRKIVKKLLPELKKDIKPDLVLVNAENSAHGYGITEKIYNELIGEGIDAITMGNHIFDKREIIKSLEIFDKIVRPANYPPSVPGRDHLIIEKNGVKIGIINLLGRVFMPAVDCPFRTGEAIADKIKEKTNIILVDIHAEATSEKCAMGYYLDGKVSAVLGTHTHVMTADEKILPGGTAFICDIGMVGAEDSIIGMKKEEILSRFLTQMPHHFEPGESGDGLFNAVALKIAPETGKALEIKSINRVVPENELKEKK